MADPVTSIGGLAPRAPARLAPVRNPATGLVALPPPRSIAPVGGGGGVLSKVLASNPDIPDWAQAAVAGTGKRRSIGAQIGGVFGGLIPGAIQLVKGAAFDASNLVRAPIRSFQHRDFKVTPKGFQGGPGITNESEFPFLSGVGKSFEDTAGRIAQLGPVEVSSIGGRHVQTYGDKYRQGDIVNAALGDALNASVVAGATGGVLGTASRAAEGLGATETAARLGQAGDVAATAGRLGGRIANAPIEAAGGVLKGGKSLWREGAQGVKEAIYSHLPEDSALAKRVVRSSTEEGRLLKKAAVETRSEPGKFGNWMSANLAKDAGVVGETKLFRTLKPEDAPSLIEQEVGLSRLAGVPQVDRMVAQQIGPEASLASHVRQVRPGETMTPEGQAMAHAYEDGTLPADVKARIDRVSDAYRKQSQTLTERGQGAVGQKELNPAQLGHGPLDDQVLIRLQEAMKPEEVAQLEQLRSELGQDKWGPTYDRNNPGPPADWKVLQRRLDGTPAGDLLANILLDPQVYPARWREAMNVAAQGEKAGAVGLPRTPEQLLAAGIENPTYMPGTASHIGEPTVPSKVPITEGFGGVRSVSAEHHRSTLGHGPYSLATAAEGLRRAGSTTEYNRILTGYMQRAEIPSAAEILERHDGQGGSPVDWEDLRTQAEDRVNAANTGTMGSGQIAKATQEEFGQLVLDELHQRGYDILNGDKLNPKPGDFNPDTRTDLMRVGPDSIVLPLGLKDRLVPYKIGTDHNIAIAMNTKANSWFKRNVLPLNAHWTIGDMTSNLLMAWRSGEINPVEMFKAGRKLKNLSPEIQDQLFNRPEFVDTGLKYQAAKALNPLIEDRAPARTTVGRGIRKVQEVGFNVNRFANRLQRHEYVYAKLTKELKARGLANSIEDLGHDPATWKTPEIQKAIKDVVNDGNDVLGTWEEMSPLEQRVATQIFPFWSWVRHITSLVARTAVDNPTRVAWTLRVGALGMNTSPQDMPDFMRGSVANPFGGGRINLNWANPFYDVGSGGIANPGQLSATVGRSLSPLLKFGVTALTNRDPSRNFNTITHRPGTNPNPIGSAIYGALGSSPFIRGAMNTAPEVTVPGLGLGLGPVRRYGSGQPIIDKATGDEASSGSRLRMAANVFNTPLATDYVPTQPASGASTIKPRKNTGLKRTGLGSGLKRVGLKG